MAKAHCENHKRFVPTCDPCKSAALRETVGFPGGRAEGPAPLNACSDHPDGCPEGSHRPEETNDSGVVGGGGSSETANDIPDYEPDEEETPDEQGLGEGEPVPVGGMFPPRDIDAARDKAESEFDPDSEGDPASHPVTPEEAEATLTKEEIAEGSAMSPLEMAILMFPQRLMSQEIEPFVQKTLAAYLEAGLTPEDAVIATAGEIIQTEQLGNLPVDEEVEEAFDAGLEAAPEITGCIEDYNQGFNDGVSALHRFMIEYFAGDEDAVAYALMRQVERQMKAMRK